ncbi:MAG: methyltransferase [Gammaproteobacteria bacterium SG8_31]|jgi:SAM-dependent methyltransferase|nr:MAG: methyltransferase [Gammaproteobacteria bacterium SG8_31]
MKRETTNRLRVVLEDFFPPLLRDSFLFRWLFRLFWGQHVDELADFRRRAAFLTADEYQRLYEKHPRVQDDTDNSHRCIELIRRDMLGPRICDVGCGTGYLLRTLTGNRRGEFEKVVGVDIVPPKAGDGEIEYFSAPVERLPFPDNHFDTVICTHVLEHILDFRAALAELRRIAARRLIVVVPREREYLYTFNPHFHFFPYVHSFLRFMIPLPEHFECMDVGRDIYYVEDRPAPPAAGSPEHGGADV